MLDSTSWVRVSLSLFQLSFPGSLRVKKQSSSLLLAKKMQVCRVFNSSPASGPSERRSPPQHPSQSRQMSPCSLTKVFRAARRQPRQNDPSSTSHPNDRRKKGSRVLAKNRQEEWKKTNKETEVRLPPHGEIKVDGQQGRREPRGQNRAVSDLYEVDLCPLGSPGLGRERARGGILTGQIFTHRGPGHGGAETSSLY